MHVPYVTLYLKCVDDYESTYDRRRLELDVDIVNKESSSILKSWNTSELA